LRAEADFIIVDTPCALAFSDAQELAPHVDATLLCIRAQEMATGSEDRLVRSLERQGSRFLGTALYDVPVAALESYRSHLYCLEPQSRRAVTRVR
jgi:Mrp family chromosome partitioning ATPase